MFTERNDAKARLRLPAWIASALLSSVSVAQAAAPHFTGLSVLTPLTGGIVNLRSQGAVTGSAPMTVQSVSILPLGLGVRANVVNGVCVEITNSLGIDLLSVGALLSVVVTNPEAPKGVRGTIPVLPGLAGNNDLGSCTDPSHAPVANAGGDRTVTDTDRAAGELVTLDASASFDPDGAIASYVWTDVRTNQTLGTGAVIQARLGDGNHQIRLTVSDGSGGPDGSASTTINVAVQASTDEGPVPNAGPDRNLLDTDGLPGELITLDASASLDVGQIVSFEWLDAQQNVLGLGVSLSVRLPDGVNDVTLRVTNSDLLSSTVTVRIAVAAPLADELLTSIPNLTPNQRAVASAVDGICGRLGELAASQTLLPDQIDLYNRCNGILAGTNLADQVEALDELGASDFAAIRTQALLFSSSQYSGIMERLAATRHGARGLSLGGLTFNVGRKPVSIAQLEQLIRQLWPGIGAGEAGDEEGSLLSDKLGLWARTNYDLGERDVTPFNDGFKGKQWGLTGGADYRVGRDSVLGMAFGYGKSDLDFRSAGGSLGTRSWTASLYGSTYPIGSLFVDAVFNYANADYDTNRRITYSEGGTLIDRTALGETGGRTLSGGVSIGYDWRPGRFSVSPALGYFHSRADVDAFAESGAAGLDLAYEDQSYSSSTANLSLSVNYAWSTRWMVVIPHLRGEYLHEFNDDVEVFGVRFAHDPFANAANPTPLIVVRSETPDAWYWRLAAGVSMQFKYGISGYVEYQRLEDFQFVSFENFTFGLRFQRSL